MRCSNRFRAEDVLQQLHEGRCGGRSGLERESNFANAFWGTNGQTRCFLLLSKLRNRTVGAQLQTDLQDLRFLFELFGFLLNLDAGWRRDNRRRS